MSDYGEELRNKNEAETKMYEIEKSYMTKKEFINLISSIDFKAIKDADLELLTGFVIDYSKGDVKTFSKNIRIN